jgi:hypothetical protein
MTEYTRCPAQDCDNKVKVWPGDKINFCCLNCWEFFFRYHIKKEDLDVGEPWPDPHSEQCRDRQMARVHEEIVIDREFMISGGPVDGMITLEGGKK